MHTLEELHRLPSGQPDAEAMHEVATWIRHFVAQPSADMGRKGPVCPFVPYALKLDTIRLVTMHIAPSELEQTLRDAAETFRNLPAAEPTARMFNFLLLLFPEIEEKFLRITAKKMMPFFLGNHMMVGPFGPNYQVASIHALTFQDVWRAPWPIIGIRWMVKDDTVFAGRCPPFDKVFEPAYEEVFGGDTDSAK
jgi:hypothetical protein